MTRCLPVVVLLSVSACASSPKSNSPEVQASPTGETATEDGHSAEDSSGAASAKPVGTKLVRDLESAPETYTIQADPGDGTGLGAYSVLRDGESVWPPSGAGCEALVECCSELTSLEGELALTCLLATGRDQDCGVAKTTITAIAHEQRVSPPASCGDN